MFSLITLFWILQSITAQGQQDHFQAAHDAVKNRLTSYDFEIQKPLVGNYIFKTDQLVTLLPTVVFLQYTNNSVYILDPSGLILSLVRKQTVGSQLSDFMNDYFQAMQLEQSTPAKVSDINTLSIVGINFTEPGEDIDGPIYVNTIQDTVIQCYGYNLTLANSYDGTIIEAVNYDTCGGSALRSFIIGKPSEFLNLKVIHLRYLNITELTVKDLMDFPKLDTLYLWKMPIEHMENGLLCHNSHIAILHYIDSFGHLTVFPRQIFNCTNPLELEYLRLEDHNITSLPAQAFGSAAEHLRVLRLWNISLEVIHKDAFSGLMKLQDKLFQVQGCK